MFVFIYKPKKVIWEKIYYEIRKRKLRVSKSLQGMKLIVKTALKSITPKVEEILKHAAANTGFRQNTVVVKI